MLSVDFLHSFSSCQRISPHFFFVEVPLSAWYKQLCVQPSFRTFVLLFRSGGCAIRCDRFNLFPSFKKDNTMTLPSLDIKEYNYPLPEERIAKHPLDQRDACKLLLYQNQQIEDTNFGQLAQLLPTRSLLVRNNTKVIKARLHFARSTGAIIEIFCLEPAVPALYEQSLVATESCTWHCMIGNARKWNEARLTAQISLANGTSLELSAERIPETDQVHFTWEGATITFGMILDALGELPIPPYLKRTTDGRDLTDYQTVYAAVEGSVAAPTAGLHFTDSILQQLRSEEHKVVDITLHVGAGTFLPVKSDRVNDHVMHREFCVVSRATVEAVLAQGQGTIVAVGTTSVRTLESLYWLAATQWEEREDPISATQAPWHLEQWIPYQEYPFSLPSRQDAFRRILDYMKAYALQEIFFTTSLIIVPGYKYRVADGLITNFHQPQSTLLLLVSALIGEQWRSLYQHALDEGEYRFLSYGDACLLLP